MDYQFDSKRQEYLHRGQQAFSGKGQTVNIQDCGPYTCKYSALLLWPESSHRRYVNEQAWLCSNKSLLRKKGSGYKLANTDLQNYGYLNYQSEFFERALPHLD